MYELMHEDSSGNSKPDTSKETKELLTVILNYFQ